MKENELIINKDLRQQAIERIDVLENVKHLFLIPEMDVMTAKQVADYFEIDIEAIQKCYQRNKEEIDNDGVCLKSYKAFLIGQDVQLEKLKGKVVIQLSNDITLEVPNRGIKCFSKRAILRIGMLLRDSLIAQEVRTQLLNTFETVTTEQKTEAIDEEIKLQAEVGEAFMSGDPQRIIMACTKVVDYKNRHIAMLEEVKTELTANNKALAVKILEWNDRSKLNRAVRLIAQNRGIPYGFVWNELYKELRYAHNIGLSQRGPAPYIDHVREDEWPLVQQSLCAICENSGISVSRIMKLSKMVNDDTLTVNTN